MEFRILGPLEVLDGTRAVEVPAGRGRALLAMLLLHAGEVVSADRLVDELWVQRPPATAATVVQGLVSRLRRELEPDRVKGARARVLQTVGPGYRLAVPPDAVDASRFKRLVDEARAEEPEGRAKRLREALLLWRGPALADFVYEPFAQSAIAALDELRLVATEERIDAELGIGRDHQLLAELEELVARHPLHERLRALQMRALYRAGRQADALEVYRRARELLVDELGVEPGSELRQLEAAVLRQDSALAGPVTTGPRATESGGGGWLPRERRLVTVVGLDLTPTGGPDSEPEAVASAGSGTTALATEVLRRYGARVEPLMGHLLVAFFGFPVSHEDDAVRAARAALDVRDAVRDLTPPDDGRIRHSSRIVIETGDVVATASGGSLAEMVAGPAVDAAFRLQRLVGDGQVVLGPRARQLVAGAILVERVRGGEGTEPAWLAVEPLTGVPVPERRTTPLVGRHRELSRLRAAYRAAVRSRRPVRCVVVGEAGIGKTRLAAELVASLGTDVRVLSGRCASFGQGLTYLPLREALHDVLTAGRDDHLGPRVAEVVAALGMGDEPGNVHALAPALARLLGAMGADQPLVVVLDDLQWAEPTFLDLIEQLEGSADAPLLLLCLARPDLLDERPRWATGDPVQLGPLEPGDTEDLVEALLGSHDDAVVAGIVERSQGNPLYAEQLLAARDESSLGAVPESLRGLLAARFDRLGPGQRDLLRCASVAGPECPRTALDALLPDEALPYVDRHLEELELKRMVTRTDGLVRFVHVLVQLAAYGSTTRDDRARLHDGYARWLQSHASSDEERDELVGYHLEQTVLNRRAAGTPDRELLEASRQAGERLADAAARALARVDETAAQNLLSRARALLPSGHPRLASVTQDLADIDLVLGRFAESQTLLLELAADSDAAGDAGAAWAARLEHARVQYIVGPAPLPTIVHVATAAQRFYAERGDDAGQGRAAFLLGCVYERQGRLALSERTFRTSLAFADRAPNMRERMATRWMIAEVLTAGPVPVHDCLVALDALELPGLEHPGLLLHRAVLTAMRAHYDEARALLERARTIMLEVMHAPRLLLFVAGASASVDLLAGRREAAERRLRETLAMARRSGEPEHLAPTAARLALLLCADGRADEAEEFVQLSTEGAHPEDVAARALGLTASALLALSRDDPTAAKGLAEEAVAAAPLEMPNVRADVLSVLGNVLAACGEPDRSVRWGAEARDLYGRKGNLARLRN